jgi:hypothetical protein
LPCFFFLSLKIASFHLFLIVLDTVSSDIKTTLVRN